MQTPAVQPMSPEMAIYKNAVQKHISNSSDEINTSEEFIHELSFHDTIPDANPVSHRAVQCNRMKPGQVINQ